MKYYMNDAEDVNRNNNSRSVTSMVTEGEKHDMQRLNQEF